MVGVAVLTALCTAGIGFYGRFLVALCGEWRRHRICFLERVPPQSDEPFMVEQREPERSIPRAA